MIQPLPSLTSERPTYDGVVPARTFGLGSRVSTIYPTETQRHAAHGPNTYKHYQGAKANLSDARMPYDLLQAQYRKYIHTVPEQLIPWDIAIAIG